MKHFLLFGSIRRFPSAIELKSIIAFGKAERNGWDFNTNVPQFWVFMSHFSSTPFMARDS